MMGVLLSGAAALPAICQFAVIATILGASTSKSFEDDQHL